MIATNNSTLQLHGVEMEIAVQNWIILRHKILRRLLFHRVRKLRVFWIPHLGLVPVLNSRLIISSSIITAVSSCSRRTEMKVSPSLTGKPVLRADAGSWGRLMVDCIDARPRRE